MKRYKIVDHTGAEVPIGSVLTNCNSRVYLRGCNGRDIHVSYSSDDPRLHCMSFDPAVYRLKILVEDEV